MGFPDAHRPQDQGAVACFGEPQGGQVGEGSTGPLLVPPEVGLVEVVGFMAGLLARRWGSV